jgi:hypothetical protein
VTHPHWYQTDFSRCAIFKWVKQDADSGSTFKASLQQSANIPYMTQVLALSTRIKVVASIYVETDKPLIGKRIKSSIPTSPL